MSAFAAAYDRGEPQLVVERMVADLETAVSAQMKLAELGGPIFLLESVEGGAVRGRYSMIGVRPDVIWRAQDGKAEINRDALAAPDAFEAEALPPLASLRALVAESRVPQPEGMPPMAAGLFGYLGYDMVREMERLPRAKPDLIGTPDAIFVRPTVMIVFDAVRDEMVIVTPVRPKEGVSARMAEEAARERIDAVVRCLEGPLPARARADATAVPQSTPVSNTDESRYLAMVRRAKEYILAGDIFQVVLAQRFSADFALGGFALYRALRRVNPSPYLCYLNFGGFEIVVSSPRSSCACAMDG